MQELCVLHVTPYSGRRVGVRGHSPAVPGHGAQPGRPRPSGHHLHDRRLRRGAAGSKPAGGPRRASPPGRRCESQSGVTLRVFPNLSNRLAYHQQAFLADRPARVPPRARAVIRRGAPARLPEPAGRDRGAMPARGRRALRAGAERHRPEHREPPARQAGLRCWPSGDDVTRHASRVLAVTEAERRQLQRDGRGRRAHPARAQPDRPPASSTTPPARAASAPAIGLAGPLVVFLGKITPRKRVDLLIRAFARLRTPGATLVIAGNDMGGGLDRACRPPAKPGSAIARASSGCCEGAGASGAARRRRRGRLSVRARDLRPGAARSAARRHAGGRVGRLGLRRGGRQRRRRPGRARHRRARWPRAIDTVLGQPDELACAAPGAAAHAGARAGSAPTRSARSSKTLYGDVMRTH